MLFCLDFDGILTEFIEFFKGSSLNSQFTNTQLVIIWEFKNVC